MSRESSEGFQDREAHWYDTVMMDTHNHTFVKTCRMWVMMRQCGFIHCNKCTSPVGDADSGGGWRCLGADIWKRCTFLKLL